MKKEIELENGYIDIKMTIWGRWQFHDKESLRVVIEEMKETKRHPDDIISDLQLETDINCPTFEYFNDTSENMTKKENDNQSVIEVYTENGELLYNQ